MYKSCIVPNCESNTRKTPDKLFLWVPMNPIRRKKWFQLARRDHKSMGGNTSCFMCEDHFDVENDIMNYMKFKMGFSQKILVRNGVLPTKFVCQKSLKNSHSGVSIQRGALEKTQKLDLVSPCIRESSTETEQELVSQCKQESSIEPEETHQAGEIDLPTMRDKIKNTEKTANSKEKNVEFEDELDIKVELDIKEELIDINDDETHVMLAEDFVADIESIGETDTTDPIKSKELQEDGLRSCLESSENQSNTTKHILVRNFEAGDIELSNKTSKGIPEDPDVLFLYSLLPDIKEMSKDQKRRFKIGVLQLTNDILQEK